MKIKMFFIYLFIYLFLEMQGYNKLIKTDSKWQLLTVNRFKFQINYIILNCPFIKESWKKGFPQKY